MHAIQKVTHSLLAWISFASGQNIETFLQISILDDILVGLNYRFNQRCITLNFPGECQKVEILVLPSISNSFKESSSLKLKTVYWKIILSITSCFQQSFPDLCLKQQIHQNYFPQSQYLSQNIHYPMLLVWYTPLST